MNTTALTVIPAAVETAVKPKPTKDEILTAMAQLHIEKLKKENEERKIRHEAVEVKIKRMLISVSKKKGTLEEEPHVYWNDYREGYSARVNYSIKDEALSDELKALMKVHKETYQLCIPCLSEAKKQVRTAMGELVSKNDRVNALLADKNSRAALEKALEKLDA